MFHPTVASDGFAQTDESLIGRVLGDKYRLRELIGVGSSGTVFQADQLALGRTVAIKILRPEFANQDRLAKRFQDEALSASRLNHPNTVSIIDYGSSSDGLLYLVMEFLRGRSLTQIIRDDGELPAPRVVELIAQVLSGLEEAHEAGVVHADLKADNIMVERRRSGHEVAKVVDFGIARLVGEEDSSSDQAICGTPEYMAPEVIRGEKPGFPADIYAVGVVLYELLTGRTPFAGRETLDILKAHVNDEPPGMSGLTQRFIDEHLAKAAVKALAKNSDDRFSSAAEFRAFISRTEGTEAAVSDVLCTGCGVMSAETFKFCPECGKPRNVRALAQSVLSEKRAKQRHAPPATPVRRTIDNIDLNHADEPKPSGRSSTVSDEPLLDLEEDSPLLPLPTVGRDALVEELFQFFTGSSADNALHVTGAPGMGESHTVRTAAIRASERGALVIVSTPDPSGLATPFYPIRSMMAGILDLPGRMTFGALTQALRRLELSERELPGIAALFGQTTSLDELSPSVRRREMFAAAIHALTAAAAERNAIYVFEDCDRYDKSSLELLYNLAERSTPSQVRVLFTSSRVLDHAWPTRVGHRALEPLDDDALQQLEAHLAMRSAYAMPTADEMREMCNGVPEHIQQLVRYVVEGGAVEAAPKTFADLITERLEMLPHDAALVAQTLSVFGLEIPTALVAVASAEHLTESEVEQALSVLDARGLVELDGDLVRFRQAVVRDVVYDSTPADVRRVLHDQAVTTLQGGGVDELVLGHHHDLAGNDVEAIRALEYAGDVSMHLGDDVGAVRILNRALGAARRRMLSSYDNATLIAFGAVAVKLGAALRSSGQIDLARAMLTEAREHCRELPETLVNIEHSQAHLLSNEGKLDAAATTLRSAIGHALAAGLDDKLATFYIDLASILVRKSEHATALEELEEGLSMLTLGDGPDVEDGPATLWRLLMRIAKLYATDKNYTKAVRYGLSALRHSERVGSRVGNARAHSLLADCYHHLSNNAAGNRHRVQAITLMRALGDRRKTAELLVAGNRLTQSFANVRSDTVREAEILEEEIGWLAPEDGDDDE